MEDLWHIRQALDARGDMPLEGTYTLVRRKADAEPNAPATVSCRPCTVVHIGARSGVYVSFQARAFGGTTKAHSVRIGRFSRLNGEGHVEECLGSFQPHAPAFPVPV